MDKQEFREFCHEEFIKRGFQKRRNMYYLKGKDILCGLYLQKSMADAYYVNYDFFIGNYDNVKNYPTKYEADIGERITVWTKSLDEDEQFLGALIEYEFYTKEEIRPYFEKVFDEYIMPVIQKGKKQLLENLKFYADSMDDEEIEAVLKKINS